MGLIGGLAKSENVVEWLNDWRYIKGVADRCPHDQTWQVYRKMKGYSHDARNVEL